MMNRLEIVRVGALVYTPVWLSWMESELTIQVYSDDYVKKPRKDGSELDGKKSNPFVSKPMFTRCQDGGALFMAGHVYKIEARGKQMGYEVVLKDAREFSGNLDYVRMPDDSVKFRFKQKDIFELMLTLDKGIVNCCTGFGKSFLLTNICRAFYKAQIVVATQKTSVVNSLYKDLVALLGTSEVGKLVGGTHYSEAQKRVVVTTTGSLRRAPLETCDMFIYDEVHGVGNNKTGDAIISRVGPARMFGLTASLSRGDKSEEIIHGLFGQVIATVEYQEAVLHGMVAPMTLFMPEFKNSPQGAKALCKSAPFNLKLQYYWNTERNNMLAEINDTINKNDQALISVATLEHGLYLKRIPALSEYTLMHFGSVTKKYAWQSYNVDDAPETLLVQRIQNRVDDEGETIDLRSLNTPLLSNLPDDGKERYTLELFRGDDTAFPCFRSGEMFYTFEQALALFEEITDVTSKGVYVRPVGARIQLDRIVAGFDVEDFKLTPKERDAMQESFAAGDIRKVISTMVIREGVNIPDLRCLTRADGGISKVLNTQVPGRASRLCDGKGQAILIDLFDVTNPWVRYRAQQRYEFYKSKGWTK